MTISHIYYLSDSEIDNSNVVIYMVIVKTGQMFYKLNNEN